MEAAVDEAAHGRGDRHQATAGRDMTAQAKHVAEAVHAIGKLHAKIGREDLATNTDGVFGAGDKAATVDSGSLVLDVTKLPSLKDVFAVYGTITFQNVTELRSTDFIG